MDQGNGAQAFEYTQDDMSNVGLFVERIRRVRLNPCPDNTNGMLANHGAQNMLRSISGSRSAPNRRLLLAAKSLSPYQLLTACPHRLLEQALAQKRPQP